MAKCRPKAKRLRNFEARGHAASGIQRNIGAGVLHSYITGYKLDDCW